MPVHKPTGYVTVGCHWEQLKGSTQGQVIQLYQVQFGRNKVVPTQNGHSERQGGKLAII